MELILPKLIFIQPDGNEKSIDAGDKYAGCTVHYVTEQLDDGEIIAQQKVKI